MGSMILITITIYHTLTVTSYNEAPSINMGPYCRTLIVTPKFNGSTEMKVSLVAEQDDCGVCFSIMQPHASTVFTNAVLLHDTLIEFNYSCLIQMQLRHFRCISHSFRRHVPVMCTSRTTFVKISSDYH